MRDDDNLFTPEERRQLLAHGLRFSPDDNKPRADWVLSWERDQSGSPADFLAEQANKGIPLFEKAWLFYCVLLMDGRMETIDGTVVRKTHGAKLKGPLGNQ
jgi:hypothetical protein